VPRPGGSAPFADPSLTAEQGYPVWLPETGATRLTFLAQPVGDAAAERLGFRIPALGPVEHILIDVAGRHHVVLRSGAVSMQLIINGANAITSHVALGLSLRRPPDIGAFARALATLETLISARHGSAGMLRPWTAQTKRLRDALIALDGRRAGASLREIATVIYGRDRIERDWPEKGLKQRLGRDLARGRAHCDGGYRDLLR
jgi:hypothetical protein